MKKILVPTDFSKNADNALSHATALAKEFGASITLLTSYRVNKPTGSFTSLKRHLHADAERSMKQTIEKAKSAFNYAGDIDYRILSGKADDVIAKFADKYDYDLIVMGTQGASGLKEIFLGSTTSGVMRKTKTPILAIPNGYPYKPIKKILLSMDDEDVSGPKVVTSLVAIAKKYAAEIMVCHLVVMEGDQGIDPTIDVMLRGVETSYYHEAWQDDINSTIDQFAKERDANLICMIRRERGFLEEIFHNSVTTREVFHTNIPLLVLYDE